jgi:ABC-type lipoprotein export system ATPase subunit
MVTHEHDIAARARRLVRIRDGQIVEDGATADSMVTASDLPAMPPSDRTP